MLSRTHVINKIRLVDNIEIISGETIKNDSIEEILQSLRKLLEMGYTKEQIKKDILPAIGYDRSIPEKISNLINE